MSKVSSSAYYQRNKEAINAKARANWHLTKPGHDAWRKANYEKVKAYGDKRRFFNSALADSHKVGGCEDCGNKNLSVLHFDHPEGNKIRDVSSMYGGTTKRMLAEIAKCRVRCANCHMIITATRRKGGQ